MNNIRRLANYILNWKFRGLFVKTLIQLCLLVMVPLCGIIGLCFFMYDNMREDELRKQCDNALNDITFKWEQIWEEWEQQFAFISFDKDIELFIYDYEMKERYYDNESIVKLIKFPTLTRSYIPNMYVYNYNNNAVLDKSGVGTIEYHQERDYILKLIEQKEQEIMISEPSEAFADKHLTFFRKFGEGKKKALLAMKISVDKLLKHINFQGQGEFYITDGSMILLSNHHELVGESIDKLSKSEKDNGENYYVKSQKVKKNHTEVIFWGKRSLMQSELGAISRFMLAFIVIMFFITMGMAIWISDKLYRPFDEILSLIRKNNDISEAAEGFEGKDELEYILKSIEKKTYFDEDISLEMARRLELLKKAQAVALQSQINPHFINNTLETINYMSIDVLGRKNEVSEMVKALADMLRDSLGNTGTLIPVSEEIAHCERYLKIQSIRYRDRFEVIWDVNKEVYDCRIIRIVLQPLLENAIYHGIKHLSNKGLIRIAVTIVDGKIRIEVSDNGLGMTDKKMEELNNRLSQDIIQESQHIGLINVYQRLKLYYGEDCELLIKSKLGTGTSIIILIPQ